MKLNWRKTRLSLFIIILICSTLFSKAQQDEKEFYTNPMSNITQIGDPFVLQHGDKYYMYCTSESSIKEGFYVWTSPDLVNWEKQGLALSNKTPGVLGIDRFWAPEVVEYKGEFYMTYSAGDTDGILKLCLAVSDDPLGPFKNYQSPWYKHDLAHIDATILIDGEKAYTYFVRDCSTNIINGRKTSQIFVAQLSNDLKTFVTEPKQVITPDQPWEDINGTRLWNEGPFVQKYSGKYYMTYSANGFNTNEYCVGYATADNPLGPWTKASENPILKANIDIGVSGPGHNSFAYSPDGTELFIIYHTHTFPDKPSGNRTMYIDRAYFKEGKMIIDGPTKSPQPYPSNKNQ
ncbi:glycoside hydrolase family 43 protein [Sunxiuqinia sp. A32]|uniref:glycoside hydrolase family 43 protein n=1 Tax=Sunxiuqinia sp. A32 TaxID=3461496 RepID=UPI0040459B6B